MAYRRFIFSFFSSHQLLFLFIQKKLKYAPILFSFMESVKELNIGFLLAWKICVKIDFKRKAIHLV